MTTRSSTSAAELLAVTAYTGSNYIQMVRDTLRKLDELHTMRDGTSDPRCVTCRDSSGRPAPWPCVTYVQLAATLGLNLDADMILEVHNAGRWLNGQPPLKLSRAERGALTDREVDPTRKDNP